MSKFSVVFGSHARGDYNNRSDFDVLLVNLKKDNFNYSIVPDDFLEKIDFVEYTEEEFINFYEKGSLFLYHILNEGVVIDGSPELWGKLKCGFVVQNDFSKELERIRRTAEMINNISIFGGKYLTPLSNMFTELKNACIFSLAHKRIYEFNKINCLKMAIPDYLYSDDLDNLKLFYDYVVRGLNNLPFNPNDEERAALLLKSSAKSIEWLDNDCGTRDN